MTVLENHDQRIGLGLGGAKCDGAQQDEGYESDTAHNPLPGGSF
jgi:hypothetical protein